MAKRRKHYRLRHHRTGIKIGFLTLIYWKTKTFLLQVTVTLTMTQMTLVAQTPHSGLTVQTVDLLYL